MRATTTDARRVVSIAAVQPRAAETGATVARIEVRKRGPIGEIRLNRPEVLNAMGREWPEDMLGAARERSEEHTSELQSLAYLVCRLLLEKKKKKNDH